MGEWICLICAERNLGQLPFFGKFHYQLSTLLALFLHRLHNGVNTYPLKKHFSTGNMQGQMAVRKPCKTSFKVGSNFQFFPYIYVNILTREIAKELPFKMFILKKQLLLNCCLCYEFMENLRPRKTRNRHLRCFSYIFHSLFQLNLLQDLLFTSMIGTAC